MSVKEFNLTISWDGWNQAEDTAKEPKRAFASGGKGLSAVTPLHLSRRGVLTGTAAFALSGCSTEFVPETGAEVDAKPRPEADSALHKLVGSADGIVVAGRKLDAGLLLRFYARHGFEPVWVARQDQVSALGGAVLRARDHGLDPELFHASLLQHDEALSPVERDVVWSHVFLSYADALGRGAVPVERRKSDEVLAPEPIDVAELLDRAIAGPDAAAAIEALAPSTPTYRALRSALLALRPDEAGGGPASDRRGALVRRRAIEVNLERQRWLPRKLPADRVWVNAADERLVMYRADKPAFTTRVVVGEDVEHNQSPEFRATIDASFYNPPWVIPADIAAAEYLPKLDRDPEYLTRNKMVMLANGEIEQLPGPEAGLGLVMFDMPNRFDVYLHDTPERDVFVRENRRISHGCIRVEDPRELAALLMDQTLEKVDEGIAAGSTTRNALPTPVPVFVVYQTAFLGDDGTVQFRPDFYKRDAGIWRLLRGAAVADLDERVEPVRHRVAAGTHGVRRHGGRGVGPSVSSRAGSTHRRQRRWF